jgi:anti-sigma factor RsiW
MNNLIDEQLSALVDGELPPEELDLLLARIDGDAALRQRLARYSLIGETMRGVTPAGARALGVAERVRAELLAEESAGGARRVPGPGWRGWAVGGGGMAAVVAIMALLVYVPVVEGPAGITPMAAAGGPAGGADDPLTSITVPVHHRLDPNSAARLTGYLMAHGEYAPGLSRSTLDSRLVAARTEQASWSRVRDAGDAR